VQQQQVAALLEGEGQVDPAALAAGLQAGRLLLIGTLEAERGYVRTAGNLEAAHLDGRLAVGDDLPDGLVRVDAGPELVDIGHPAGVADPDLARVGGVLPRDHLEQGGLADAVRAQHAHDAVARQREAHVLEQLAVAEALRQVLYLDYRAAEPRAR